MLRLGLAGVMRHWCRMQHEIAKKNCDVCGKRNQKPKKVQ